jgi:redox-sensitive bicupin YhaK (pirin superfamily)
MLRAYAGATMTVMLSRRGFVVGSAGAWLVGCLARRFDGDARIVAEVVPAEPRRDGAGVSLRRALGGATLPLLDPFLLLDEIRSADPTDWQAGFPTHPHRGFETVSYVLAGAFEHADSVGNRGSIADGGVQWMTAGRGIVHSEMPAQPAAGRELWGLQLWVNLPARHKMTAPRYQDLPASDVLELAAGTGGSSRLRVVAGRVEGKRGPVSEIVADPLMVDATVPAGGAVRLAVPGGHAAFVYALEGALRLGPEARLVERGELAVLGRGREIRIASDGPGGGRALVVAGAPIGEPVARRGPFVMNTDDELDQAVADYRAGRLGT